MNQKRKELGLREAAPVDNNTPKGVPNPFVLFNVEQRPKLKDQHPGMSTAEMNQLVTNGWKALTQVSLMNSLITQWKNQMSNDAGMA